MYRPCKPARALAFEPLESRTVLSTVHAVPTFIPVGTVSGQVSDINTSLGVPGVRLQLVNSVGHVDATVRSDTHGDYTLPVPQSGLYVVREVTPRGYTQVLPTFANGKPQGSFAGSYGNSSWNYSSSNTDPKKGPVGPAGWVNILNPGVDGFESPINIATPAINLSSELTINYNPTVPSQSVNNGHQIQVKFNKSADATATVGGTTYYLNQFHFHGFAETTLHGRHNPLELHYVMTDAAGAETVVAVFLKLGKFNPALQPVLATATQFLNYPNSSVNAPTTPIDFSGLLPHNRDGSVALQGWFYTGSLTTPPLSQPVNWFVLQKPIELSTDQLRQYDEVAAGSGFFPNDRPTQPLDGRKLNEISYNVSFGTTPIENLNFVLTPKVSYIY